MPEQNPIWDCHCHTELAYCGSDINVADALNQAALKQLAGICIVEHSPQLYCTAEEFWSALHIKQPRCCVRNSERTTQFRQLADSVRSDKIRVGFEVEIDDYGKLICFEEDKLWADILLGAIHWLPHTRHETGDQEFREKFIKTSGQLIDSGVHILAHPFRVFSSTDRPKPTELYTRLAKMLAKNNVAAEINLHHRSQPDVNFIQECLSLGVKIALGSDAHSVEMVGNLQANLELLQIAAGKKDVTEHLYIPPAN